MAFSTIPWLPGCPLVQEHAVLTIGVVTSVVMVTVILLPSTILGRQFDMPVLKDMVVGVIGK